MNEKGKIALLPFSHYSAWALRGKRVKPCNFLQCALKISRGREKTLPRAACSGVFLKSEEFLLTAQKKFSELAFVLLWAHNKKYHGRMSVVLYR